MSWEDLHILPGWLPHQEDDPGNIKAGGKLFVQVT